MRSILLPTLLMATALAGCGQEIVVLQCDGHVDVPDPDAGTPLPDSGPGILDSGVAMDGGTPDSGGMDGGTPDSGAEGCTGTTYCIDRVDVSERVAVVRQPVVFTPSERNPNGAVLTYRTVVAELVGTRRAVLPPFEARDVTVNLVTDPNTGVTTFTLSDVPTWFSTTTFTVRIHASAPGGPDVFAEADVTVKGNVVFSAGVSVYAVASDGRPARSVNFTDGRLIQGQSFIRTPEDIVIARDGTMLVFDSGASPERIRRFRLSGENVALPDFQFEDAGAMPIISFGHSGRGMGQLSDGRIALVEYEFSRTVESRILVWNEDGTFDRALSAPNNTTIWTGVAGNSAGEMLVGERNSNGRLIRLDPNTGIEQGVVVPGVSQLYGVMYLPGGTIYMGLGGSAVRVSPGGAREQVSQLPSSGTTEAWEYFSPFGEGRVLATRDLGHATDNIAIIEGARFVSWLRVPMANNVYADVNGVGYLD